jgi:4-hydroxyphenylpyruvate dioxygenase
MDTQNPLGLLAIDHLEFTTDSLHSEMFNTFKNMGFAKAAESKTSTLFQQGQIRFLIHKPEDQNHLAAKYFAKHGEGVSKISFLVENVEQTLELALKRGAQLKVDLKTDEGWDGVIKTASIQGFGDVLNEFVERPASQFRYDIESTKDSSALPLTTRFSRIDHLTNNVPKGEMDHWVDFYKRIYGFQQTRYFDIKGIKTGLNSKVVQLANNSIIIPINEPEVHHGKSQIQEFLDRHNGAGVQHIALMTPDIISTLGEIRQRGMKFLNVPSTYYAAIGERKLNVTEDLAVLEKLNLLVDGDESGYLLQIFSDTYIGPLFFEFIQRKNHWGFGEGNFQALFDAIERDQIQRGYLK